MAAVPIVGYPMVDAKGYGVAFFGLPTPGLPVTDETLAKRLGGLHEWPAWGLVALVALHLAAAVWHPWALHDDVPDRMLPGARAV
jgi:cytochrome b561